MKKEDLRADLLSHLQGSADEQERRRIELAVLEDDAFFDQLRATEAELVESYIGGELEESASLRLAELIGRSERLRESAETSLALGVRPDGREKETGPALKNPRGARQDSGSPRNPSAAASEAARGESSSPRLRISSRLPFALLWLALILANLWLLARVVDLRRELHEMEKEVEGLRGVQESLTIEVELQSRELERQRQQQLLWQRQWADSEAPGQRADQSGD